MGEKASTQGQPSVPAPRHSCSTNAAWIPASVAPVATTLPDICHCIRDHFVEGASTRLSFQLRLRDYGCSEIEIVKIVEIDGIGNPPRDEQSEHRRVRKAGGKNRFHRAKMRTRCQ